MPLESVAVTITSAVVQSAHLLPSLLQKASSFAPVRSDPAALDNFQVA